MARISEEVVDALQPSPEREDLFIWDQGEGALTGFGIRMKPSGSAAYLVQYRNKEGRTRRLAIGKVGSMPLAEARALAVAALQAVEQGGDPSAERHPERKSSEHAPSVPEHAPVPVAAPEGPPASAATSAPQGRADSVSETKNLVSSSAETAGPRGAEAPAALAARSTVPKPAEPKPALSNLARALSAVGSHAGPAEIGAAEPKAAKHRGIWWPVTRSGIGAALSKFVARRQPAAPPQTAPAHRTANRPSAMAEELRLLSSVLLAMAIRTIVTIIPRVGHQSK